MSDSSTLFADPDNLDGKVLLVTGASSGIGAETARMAASAGMKVVLAARRLDRLEALAAELGAGDTAIAVPCDVTDWDDQQRAVEAATQQFGRIDAVFANAGFGAKRGWLEESPEHWRDMVLTNVYGCALTIRAALPALLESGGHALVTGSIAGRRVLPGSLYSATKFAVHAMAEAVRQEVTEQGVRVTIISPGMTDTPFFEDGVPAGSLLDDDIARAVLWSIAQPARVAVNEVAVRPTVQRA